MASLFDPVTVLAGIGPVRAAQLHRLGLDTLYDLIAFFPRAYEDRTRLVEIDQLQADTPACFRAVVITPPVTSHIRKGLDLTRLTVADHSGRLRITFFNQPYRADSLRYGEEYYFYGALTGDYAGYQMNNPSVEPADSAGSVTRRILPIYPLTAGLNNTGIGKAVAQALAACLDTLPEVLPEPVRRRYDLMDARTAYQTVHMPPSMEALAGARRRVVFEEFFLFSAGLLLTRSRRAAQARHSLHPVDMGPFLGALPFPLTGAQRRAMAEILSDLRQPHPMNRLVQGDVGSGKTVVAAAAAYFAAQNGVQTALMAPTEILAEQHLATLSALFAPLGLRCALLTGSTKTAERRALLEQIANGQVDVVVGTHALISESTQFADLGLVIADEQHRFGVNQRAALAAKGSHPHLLVLSATPIPRTLSLILYGDLDVSVIDELPPGRQTVDTFLVGEGLRSRINAFIRKHAAAGHQVYIVCPAVEETEVEALKSAELWASTLQQRVFPDLRVGLLHGRMKGAEKDTIMRAFKEGEFDILVATTVIEVGVDVPNATLMIVENADRFGLSQLHQLRGRVGRGKDKSYCILISNATDDGTRARLKALCKTNDGFQIAQADLQLRGPGDFFGSRQSGLPAFKVASLQLDLELLRAAQQAAREFLERADMDAPENAPMLQRIRALFDGGEDRFN